MRWRWSAAAVGAAMAGAVLAGCGLPDGVDGTLTNGWGTVGEPVGWAPEPGRCHLTDHNPSIRLIGYKPIDCVEPHASETVYVGTFPDDVTGDLPGPGSQPMRDAFRVCEEEAAEFLGADFRHGRLRLEVTKPSPAAWKGGSRWFGCELMQRNDDNGNTVSRTGGLRDALAAPSDLHRGCYVAKDSEDDDDDWFEVWRSVDCSEPHQVEFVGVWRAGKTPWPETDDEGADARMHGACLGLVADYVDVPDDAALPYRISTAITWPVKADWEAGNRGVLCYLWLWGEDIAGSLKGAGTEGLPIRYG